MALVLRVPPGSDLKACVPDDDERGRGAAVADVNDEVAPAGAGGTRYDEPVETKAESERPEVLREPVSADIRWGDEVSNVDAEACRQFWSREIELRRPA